MPEKILVTYASRTGTTAGVAEAIAKTFLCCETLVLRTRHGFVGGYRDDR